MDREELWTGDVHAAKDERGTNVPLISVIVIWAQHHHDVRVRDEPEEMLLEHGHRRDHMGLSTGRERVQLDVGRDGGGDEFRVCGRPCTATANGL